MKMFPIQDGPSVPWEAMAPHESMSLKNHGQTLERIVARGGFGCGEAWLIVNGLELGSVTKVQWDEYKANWIAYAERINLHFEELESLRTDVPALCKALEEAVEELRGAAVTFKALNRPDYVRRIEFRLSGIGSIMEAE